MARATHSKIRISITIFPFVNTMLEKVSKRSGTSKSSVVETALKEFLRAQLAQDSKALSTMSFPDIPSEEEWLSLQSPLE